MLRVFLIKSMKEVKERYHMGKERRTEEETFIFVSTLRNSICCC